MTSFSQRAVRCRLSPPTKATVLMSLLETKTYPYPLPKISKALLAWHDGIIPSLADTIRKDKLWVDLPILADAVEESRL